MRQSIQDTITLTDAIRLTGPMAFNIMLKPAGSLCNLDCSYCYYLDKSEMYGGMEPIMSDEMLEIVVREYIKANDVPQVTFNWHGGEPLVLGLDFYRKAIALEKEYADGKKILNTLQTNGTLITREWAEFFKENDFLIGISLDGPQDVHDKFRRDKGGAPTFERVIPFPQAAEQDAGVPASGQHLCPQPSYSFAGGEFARKILGRRRGTTAHREASRTGWYAL